LGYDTGERPEPLKIWPHINLDMAMMASSSAFLPPFAASWNVVR
jgi:hypothetical protein